MKKEKKDELALDILREMGNIGIGSAVTALSNMTGKPIDERFPKAMRLNYGRLIEILGAVDESVLGILFPVCGELSGYLLFVWKQDFVSEIFKALTGAETSLRELDEERISIIKEIANIMASSYFTAISSYTGKNIELHAPAVSVDMVGAVVTDQAGWNPSREKDMVCIQNGFSTQKEGEVSHLCFMMHQESAIHLLQSLGVEI